MEYPGSSGLSYGILGSLCDNGCVEYSGMKVCVRGILMLSLLKMTKTKSLHMGPKGPDGDYSSLCKPELRLARGVQRLA